MNCTIDEKADYCTHATIDLPWSAGRIPEGSPLPSNESPKCNLTGENCVASEIYHFTLSSPYQTIWGYNLGLAKRCPTHNIPKEIAKNIRDFREVRKQPAEQRGSL